jgi:hypothetical protein
VQPEHAAEHLRSTANHLEVEPLCVDLGEEVAVGVAVEDGAESSNGNGDCLLPGAPGQNASPTSLLGRNELSADPRRTSSPRSTSSAPRASCTAVHLGSLCAGVLEHAKGIRYRLERDQLAREAGAPQLQARLSMMSSDVQEGVQLELRE